MVVEAELIAAASDALVALVLMTHDSFESPADPDGLMNSLESRQINNKMHLSR